MRLPPILAFVLIACAACGDYATPGEGAVDAGVPVLVPDPICAEPPQKLPLAQAVTNGSASPTSWEISPGQQLAVGALLEKYGRRFTNVCTGTLVAPDVVLTAAHCVVEGRSTLNPEDVQFAVGPDAASPRHVFGVREVHVHPSYSSRVASDATHDEALLVLTENANEAVPELEFIALHRTPITREFVGTRVQAVGYGTTESDDRNTRKWWTTEAVSSTTEADVVVDGHGTTGVCFGDSGGPLLHLQDGTLRVVGVLSWGDPSCVGKDHFGRVDKNAAWIDETSGGATAHPLCGRLDEAGECEGRVLRRCVEGLPVATDCAVAGRICKVADGRADCVPDPCQGLTAFGSCEGTVLAWCDEGRPQRYDCGRCGWDCGYAGDQIGMSCR